MLQPFFNKWKIRDYKSITEVNTKRVTILKLSWVVIIEKVNKKSP